MKGFYIISIFVFVTLIQYTKVSAQTFSKYTTVELLKKAKDSGFQAPDPSEQMNDAIPLIDSLVAVALTRIGDPNANDFFKYAVGLQCRDDSLKQRIVNYLLPYDKLCSSDALVAKNDYNRISGYEYGRIRNALFSQIEKDDTDFLNIATREFEFWAPFADEYQKVVLKAGIGQLSMGKRKFNPCVLAAPANCWLWASSIYYLAGREKYGSSDEKLNEVYNRLKRGTERMMDRRKDFIRLGKEDIVATDTTINSLDSLDFETISELKDKFDKIRRKDNYQIVIYTHQNKGLLYTTYTDKMSNGFSKELVSISSLQLVEIKTPKAIQLTKIGYRDRYLFQ
ncbi:MAG: hypothetical protein ACRDE5_00730 [Ginsengibacter sp.]